jgi:hypothetical protein
MLSTACAKLAFCLLVYRVCSLYVGPTDKGKARKPETLLDYIEAAVKRSLISSDLQRLISIDPCRCCQIVDADLGGYWICFGKVFIYKTLYKPPPETCSIFPSP